MIRIATAAAAAFALATAAAATAAPQGDIAAWQQSIETQFNGNLRGVGDKRITRSEAGTVAVRLAADGTVSDVSMARSTGVAAFDREAIAAARAVRIPALPQGYGDRPVTIAMNVFFGTSDEAIAARVKASARAAEAATERFAARATPQRLAAR